MRLEAKNVVFGYSKKDLILDHVNFSIEEGEKVALLGPSGCGKSTLSGILAGNLKPFCGEVLLDEMPLTRKGYNPVQLISQHPEKAINPRWRLGRTLTEAFSPSDTLIKKAGIEPLWFNRYPAELSGGELQRFCIVRTLSDETKFLIADEISTMLDVITQAQIWNLILTVVEERNLGLLLITHNTALAGNIADRTVKFEDISKPLQLTDPR